MTARDAATFAVRAAVDIDELEPAATRRRERSRLRISACSLCHKISSDRFCGHWNCGADVGDWDPGPGRSAASLTVLKQMTPRTRTIRKWPPVGEHRKTPPEARPSASLVGERRAPSAQSVKMIALTSSGDREKLGGRKPGLGEGVGVVRVIRHGKGRRHRITFNVGAHGVH